MTRLFVILFLVVASSASLFCSDGVGAVFTFGLQRDFACCNQCVEAPCMFPVALNPCAVPCRPPGYQEQALPCAYESACGAARLPCHGVSYGSNPYPLFRAR
jgi:hypothetical protein